MRADKGAVSGVEPLSESLAPSSKTQDRLIEDLIDEIVARLVIAAEKHNEIVEIIRFRLRAAKKSLEGYEKTPLPGALKRKASALSLTLKKARKLSQEIEPLFGAAFDDPAFNCGRRPSLDDFGALFGVPHERQPVLDQYADYRSYLDQSIEVADRLIAAIIVPPGQKRRDVAKGLAKQLATDLVADFPVKAALRPRKRGPEELAPLGGERDATNAIASLAYEILTGHEGREIPEPPPAYAPPTIKTRSARKLTTKK